MMVGEPVSRKLITRASVETEKCPDCGSPSGTPRSPSLIVNLKCIWNLGCMNIRAMNGTLMFRLMRLPRLPARALLHNLSGLGRRRILEQLQEPFAAVARGWPSTSNTSRYGT